MVRCLTFGYRTEGLMLHQWARENTVHVGAVIPFNRERGTGSIIGNWAQDIGVYFLVHDGEDDRLFENKVKILKPDIILVNCYTYRLVPEILSIPPLGCINIHPGKLPEYRGKDPINATLDDGNRLWVTLHYMDEGYDTGDIIAEKPLEYWFPKSRWLAGVYTTCMGLDLLNKYWERICTGTAPRLKQKSIV